MGASKTAEAGRRKRREEGPERQTPLKEEPGLRNELGLPEGAPTAIAGGAH